MIDTDEIKRRLGCDEYLIKRGYPLKNGRCVSPIRPEADNPTAFYAEHGFWFDYVSRCWGDVIDLAAILEHNENRGRAIHALAEELGVPNNEPYDDAWRAEIQDLCTRTAAYHEALTDEDRDYLYKRGLSSEDIKRLMIGRVTDGYLRGRLFLPYFKNGYVCYYATRAMPGSNCPDSKYMKASLKDHPAYEHIPWGLQTLGAGGDTLIISEGYFDAVAWEIEGYPVISPITGAFSSHQWPTVLAACRRFKRVLIIFDNDEKSHAGDRFTATTARKLFENHIPFVVAHTPEGVKDVNDYYAAGNSLQDLVDSAVDGLEYMDSQHSGFIFDLLEIPHGYTGDNWILNYHGIKQLVPSKKRGEPPVWETVTNTPVFPIAYLENTTEGIRKVELRYLADERLNTIICDKETIANKSKIISLANDGIGVNSLNANALIQYFAHVEAMNRYTIPRQTSVSHIGWIGDDFLPYSGDIRFDGETENRPMYLALKPRGDYDAWVSFTHKLRRNLYLRLTMAASFASPLIERCDALPFIFHLWGSTGKGKTVALMVAMSVWGDPTAGKLTRTLNTTNAAMMATAAFLRNIPFAGDELQSIKNKEGSYDDIIMQVTEGIERGRLDRNARNRPTRSWRNAFLFTGEERCTNDFSGGGTKNRVIEVEAEGEIVTNGNEVVNFITKNHGHAGKKFIDYVTEKDVNEEYTRVFNRVISECSTTPKQAMAITLMLIADQFACECLYHDETPLAVEQVTQFLKEGEEVDVSERAYNFLMDWIAANSYKLLDDQGKETWGKAEGHSVYIIDTYLNRALRDQGFSFDAVKKDWARKGYVRKRGDTFKQRKGINGKTPYCIEVVLQRG